MAIGSPRTKGYRIGTFEVRMGPLTKSGLLAPEHSIGVIDNVTLNVEQNSVDLLAGFPQLPVDTAITSQITGLTASMREYSRRNLNVLLGNGLFDYDATATDLKATVVTTSAIAKDEDEVVLTTDVSFAANDIVVFFSASRPERVTVAKVSSYTSGTKTIVLDSDTKMVANGADTNAYEAGEVVYVYKSLVVPIGAVTTVNYFSVQLISTDRGTSRTTGFNFWKAAIASGMSLGMQPADFASTDLQLKFLQPATSEYAPGGALAHMADFISVYPVGMMFAVSDGAV